MNDKEYSAQYFIQEAFLYVSYPNCLCRTAKMYHGERIVPVWIAVLFEGSYYQVGSISHCG